MTWYKFAVLSSLISWRAQVRRPSPSVSLTKGDELDEIASLLSRIEWDMVYIKEWTDFEIVRCINR